MSVTLYAHDSKYGVFTLNWDSTNSWFTGCKNVSYPGGAGCSASSASFQYYMYIVNNNPSLFVFSWFDNRTGCIAPGCGCPVPTTGICNTYYVTRYNEWILQSSSCVPYVLNFGLSASVPLFGYSLSDTVVVNTSST